MAKNMVYGPKRTRSLPVADGMVSGAVYMVGKLPVVLLTDEGKGGNADNFASCALDGAVKAAVATATTVAVGGTIYYITSSKSLTTTDNSGANPVYGYALTPKGSTAGQVITIELSQV